MDAVLSPPPSYAEIAEKLLAHRFPRASTSRASEAEVHQAFHALAEVFALDQAAAAGKAPREIMATLADGLAEAVQAIDTRILLKSGAGALSPLSRQSSTLIAPIASEVARDGKARSADDGVACAPLTRQDGELVGVFQMSGKRAGRFAEADLRLAT